MVFLPGVTLHFDDKSYAGTFFSGNPSSAATDLKELNKAFYYSLAGGDTAGSRSLLKQILIHFEKSGDDSLTISDSHYYTGIYFLLRERFDESEKHLTKSVEIREGLSIFDSTYPKHITTSEWFTVLWVITAEWNDQF